MLDDFMCEVTCEELFDGTFLEELNALLFEEESELDEVGEC